ncbi:MAG: hypothetical protein AB7W59_02225 [Acidimicrobiia bacterium]
MGFKLPSTTIVIDFPDGHELHGVEVYTRSVPLGSYLELSKLARTADGTGENSITALEELIVQFADVALKRWNLEDDTGEVPASAAGLRSLDMRYAMAIITAWLAASGGEVPAPLEQTSSAGEQSAVPLPPMEVASTSPPS